MKRDVAQATTSDTLDSLKERVLSRARSHGLDVEFSEDGVNAVFTNRKGEKTEMTMDQLRKLYS